MGKFLKIKKIISGLYNTKQTFIVVDSKCSVDSFLSLWYHKTLLKISISGRLIKMILYPDECIIVFSKLLYCSHIFIHSFHSRLYFRTLKLEGILDIIWLSYCASWVRKSRLAMWSVLLKVTLYLVAKLTPCQFSSTHCYIWLTYPHH